MNFSDPFGNCPERVGGDGATESVDDCPQDIKDAWAEEHIINTSSNNTDIDGVDAELYDAVVRASMAWGADIGISAGREDGHSREGRHGVGGAVDINSVNGARFRQMSSGGREAVGNLLLAEIVNRLPSGRLQFGVAPGMAVRLDVSNGLLPDGRQWNAGLMRRLIAAHWNHLHLTVRP